MDVDAVRTLVAVHRHGTVSAAADALGFTPSAVSQQVKRLTADVGVALTERRGRGLALTAAGLRLVEDGAALVQAWDALAHACTDGAPVAAGTVRLGAFASAFRDIVAPALAHSARIAPHVRVQTREIDPWEAIRSVDAGYLDVALVHNWDPAPLEFPERLEHRELAVDRADVLLRTDDPLAQRGAVTPADLAHRQWVSVAPGSICHQWLTGLFHSAGVALDIAHHALEWPSHVALVDAGVAVALAPRWGRPPLPDGVCAVPLVDPVPTRRAIAVWRSAMGASPAVRSVLEALTAVAADLPGPGSLPHQHHREA